VLPDYIVIYHHLQYLFQMVTGILIKYHGNAFEMWIGIFYAHLQLSLSVKEFYKIRQHLLKLWIRVCSFFMYT